MKRFTQHLYFWVLAVLLCYAMVHMGERGKPVQHFIEVFAHLLQDDEHHEARASRGRRGDGVYQRCALRADNLLK